MDFEKIINSSVYTFLDRLFSLVLINILWFIISILGLGIFTIYPATLSMFILLNAFVKKKSFPLFTAFFKTFIKVYWKAQKVFIIFLLIGIVLFFNIRIYYLQVIDNFSYVMFFGLIMTLIIMLLYLLALIQSFFVLLCFPEFKTLKTIKFSFILGVAFTFSTLLVLIIFLVPLVIMIFYPFIFPLVFLILISFIIYISIKIIMPKYNKISSNQKPLEITNFI